MSINDVMKKHGFAVDLDSLDYDLLVEAAEQRDIETYAKLRQLCLLREIRDGISELTDAVNGID